MSMPPRARYDNYVHTTHYTIYNFICAAVTRDVPPTPLDATHASRAQPRAVRRLANCCFLMIAILHDAVLAVLPLPAAGPVSSSSASACAREGVEDYRYLSDKESNARRARALDSAGSPRSSSNIRVGDIVWVKDKQPIPADMLLLWSSANNGGARAGAREAGRARGGRGGRAARRRCARARARSRVHRPMNLGGETNLKRPKAKDDDANVCGPADAGGGGPPARAHLALGCVEPAATCTSSAARCASRARSGAAAFGPARPPARRRGGRRRGPAAAARSRSATRPSRRRAAAAAGSSRSRCTRGTRRRRCRTRRTRRTSSGFEKRPAAWSRSCSRQLLFCFVAAVVMRGRAPHARARVPRLPRGLRRAVDGLPLFWANVILLHTFIPASLVATSSSSGRDALFINWDLHMMHGYGEPPPRTAAAAAARRRSDDAAEKRGNHVRARAPTRVSRRRDDAAAESDASRLTPPPRSLVRVLRQDGHAHRDKMEFRKCCVAGRRSRATARRHAGERRARAARVAAARARAGGRAPTVLRARGRAHGAARPRDGQVSYNADSPDEVAP